MSFYSIIYSNYFLPRYMEEEVGASGSTTNHEETTTGAEPQSNRNDGVQEERDTGLQIPPEVLQDVGATHIFNPVDILNNPGTQYLS